MLQLAPEEAFQTYKHNFYVYVFKGLPAMGCLVDFVCNHTKL